MKYEIFKIGDVIKIDETFHLVVDVTDEVNINTIRLNTFCDSYIRLTSDFYSYKLIYNIYGDVIEDGVRFSEINDLISIIQNSFNKYTYKGIYKNVFLDFEESIEVKFMDR